MIWACFVGCKVGPIVFVEGTVNQDVYIGILDQYFVPFIEALNADGQTHFEFQQDNALPHTAKRTTAWLESIAQKYNLNLMFGRPIFWI